ncbi:MAG: TerB family tellurite resistance protein [Thermodesulfobacteriota bacterium]
MFIQRQAEEALRPDQVKAMAHGLYHLAEIDGITPSEKELLESFLKEGNADLSVDALAKIPFSLDELLYSLEATYLRKSFMRIAFLVAQADGAISTAEMAELRRIAQALGITEPLEDIAADLEGTQL